MPRTIKVEGKMLEVATEEELLAFANTIRQAGGANVIEALLPSQQHDADSCLIANALNFQCSVETTGPRYADGSFRWIMILPANLTDEQRKSLGAVNNVRLELSDYFGRHLVLPDHIGNAAHAFDAGAAFQEYVAQEAA